MSMVGGSRLRRSLAWALLLLPWASTVHALPPELQAIRAHGAVWATSLRFAPDGRLFHTELLTGRIMVYADAFSVVPAVWATVAVDGTGERGLHGMTFHPDFPDSPYVYVFHIPPPGTSARVTRLVDQAGAGVSPIVLVDGIPTAGAIHNGGRLAFGPDGMLYVTTGDNEQAALAQDETRLEGKILRFSRGGRPAPGNPFGQGNPVAMTGVRNPYGLSFDPLDGIGYFTENGPECDDEINLVLLGANYGWSDSDPCGLQPPSTQPAIYTVSPTLGPTGLVICRGGAFGDYEGDLFFGSVNPRAIHRVRFEPGMPDVVASMEIFHVLQEIVLDMTIGPDGMLWASTHAGIWVIRPAAPLAVAPDPEARHLTAHPNPFSQRVAFVLPSDRIDVLELYDVTGRRVRRWSGPLGGTVTWDGHDDEGRQSPAGVYLARAISPGGVSMRRVVRTTR